MLSCNNSSHTLKESNSFLNMKFSNFGSCFVGYTPGASQVALIFKNLPANAGDIRDVGWIPGSGRSPGVGNSSPLWYSCLENPMERGAWWATDHGVGHKELDMSEHTCTHICHLLSILYHLCIVHHLSIHLCISLLSSLSLC